MTRMRQVTAIVMAFFAVGGSVIAAGKDTTYDPTKPLENPSLLWGTYRPQIYFGIRSALSDSILSGLMWFAPNRFESILAARHECNEGEKIDGYGWKYHDGRSFAIQEIRDTENNYLIETSWIKTGHENSDDSAGHSGSWAVRIKGTVIDKGENRMSVFDDDNNTYSKANKNRSSSRHFTYLVFLVRIRASFF